MKINNTEFGGFIVSNNVLIGYAIKYTFREKSKIKNLNGWTIYSIIDDDIYVSDYQNFTILNAESMFKLAPIMPEIFSAPYGTDLCWIYQDGVHTGFYDLKKNSETNITKILNDL